MGFIWDTCCNYLLPTTCSQCSDFGDIAVLPVYCSTWKTIEFVYVVVVVGQTYRGRIISLVSKSFNQIRPTKTTVYSERTCVPAIVFHGSSKIICLRCVVRVWCSADRILGRKPYSVLFFFLSLFNRPNEHNTYALITTSLCTTNSLCQIN